MIKFALQDSKTARYLANTLSFTRMLNIIILVLLAPWFTFVHGHSELKAAKVARKMVYSESLLHFNSLTPFGLPVSMVEYYISSDGCHDVEGLSNNGNPILLLSQMSTSYKNFDSGRNVTMTIEKRSLNPFETPMSSPRGYFVGTLTKLDLDPANEKKLAKHFVHRHPDAKHWLPHDDETHVHDTLWLEFDVKNVYFVGGFGSNSYIGNISGDAYHQKLSHCHEEKNEPGYGLIQSLKIWAKVLFTEY